MAIAADTGMRVLEARFRHRLGALLRGSGHDRAARPLLRRAIELAEGCGAESVAKKAREELKLAHGRAQHRVVDPDALTPAELRVCKLAEQGVSQKDIARQLIRPLDTVETHLQHIYRNLRIKSPLDLLALTRHPRPPPPPH